MYLCSHIRNLNMAKSTTVVFNLRNKEGICEEIVHLHDVHGHMVVRSVIYSQPV